MTARKPVSRIELAALRIAIAELEDLLETLELLEPSSSPESLARTAAVAVDADLKESGINVAPLLREIVGRTAKVETEGADRTALVSFKAWGVRR